MNLFVYIFLFTTIGSIVSLIGGILLLFREKLTLRVTHLLASFAAGTLLGTAFFDLFPEALREADKLRIDHTTVFVWVLSGILFFFLFERAIHWFHHHQHTHEDITKKPIIPLIVMGDTVHNFIDGIAIAATFAVSVPLGIVTSLAVGAHEIPQEIGDFGILLKEGVKRKKILLVNVLTAFSAYLGALLTFYLGSIATNLSFVFLSITAGFFIYISLSDLVPEIHHENRKGFAFMESMSLLIGVVTIYIVITIIEKLLGGGV